MYHNNNNIYLHAPCTHMHAHTHHHSHAHAFIHIITNTYLSNVDFEELINNDTHTYKSNKKTILSGN